jgi:hypothetical protein
MDPTPPPPRKCAPSRNLNVAYPHFDTAKEMYEHLLEITEPVRFVYIL